MFFLFLVFAPGLQQGETNKPEWQQEWLVALAGPWEEGLTKPKNPRFARFFMRLQSACASTASFRRIKKPTLLGGFFGFVAGTGLEPVTFGL